MGSQFVEKITRLMTPTQAEGFWKHVQRCSHASICPDCCWEWQGETRKRYGMVHLGGKRTQRTTAGAHRVAWVLIYGDLDDTLLVLHRCDNPPCCNPAHLWVGRQEDNMADMVQKGRSASGERNGIVRHPDRHWSRVRSGSAARGERHGIAKLTAEHVLAIRALRSTQTIYALAAQFGVSKSLISAIHARKVWAHLPEEPPHA